jgi:hypothetical protein
MASASRDAQPPQALGSPILVMPTQSLGHPAVRTVSAYDGDAGAPLSWDYLCSTS